MKEAAEPRGAVPPGPPLVLMLSAAHPPTDVRIVSKEGAALAAAGWEVIHLCPEPEDGTRAPESAHGVRIRTYPKAQGWLARYLGRKALAKRAEALLPDVVHAHEPDSWLAAVRVAKRTGAYAVLDVHEHYPSRLDARVWRPFRGLARWAIRRLCTRVAKRADAVIVAKDGLADAFPNVHDIVPVRNYAAPLPVTPRRHRPGPVTLVHLGALGKARGSMEMLRALQGAPPDTRLLLIGRFTDGSEEEFRKATVTYGVADRVTGYAWMPHEEAVRTAAAEADIGLVLFQPGVENHRLALPHKLFDCMVAGIPVIVPAFAEEVAEVVREAGCGVLVDTTDPKAIAAAVKALSDPELRQELGDNGRRAALGRFSWNTEAERLVRLYRELAPLPGQLPEPAPRQAAPRSTGRAEAATVEAAPEPASRPARTVVTEASPADPSVMRPSPAGRPAAKLVALRPSVADPSAVGPSVVGSSVQDAPGIPASPGAEPRRFGSPPLADGPAFALETGGNASPAPVAGEPPRPGADARGAVPKLRVITPPPAAPPHQGPGATLPMGQVGVREEASRPGTEAGAPGQREVPALLAALDAATKPMAAGRAPNQIAASLARAMREAPAGAPVTSAPAPHSPAAPVPAPAVGAAPVAAPDTAMPARAEAPSRPAEPPARPPGSPAAPAPAAVPALFAALDAAMPAPGPTRPAFPVPQGAPERPGPAGMPALFAALDAAMPAPAGPPRAPFLMPPSPPATPAPAGVPATPALFAALDAAMPTPGGATRPSLPAVPQATGRTGAPPPPSAPAAAPASFAPPDAAMPASAEAPRPVAGPPAGAPTVAEAAQALASRTAAPPVPSPVPPLSPPATPAPRPAAPPPPAASAPRAEPGKAPAPADPELPSLLAALDAIMPAPTGPVPARFLPPSAVIPAASTLGSAPIALLTALDAARPGAAVAAPGAGPEEAVNGHAPSPVPPDAPRLLAEANLSATATLPERMAGFLSAPPVDPDVSTTEPRRLKLLNAAARHVPFAPRAPVRDPGEWEMLRAAEGPKGPAPDAARP